MSALFVVIGVVQLGLAVQVGVRSKGRPWPLLVLMLVLVGLAYDNGIVGVGAAIGEGDGLQTLNVWRFVLHALLTPLMLLVGRAIAVGAGARGLATAQAGRVVAAIVGVLIAVGLAQEVWRLNLVLELEQGTVRYIAADPSGPPIAAILTIIGLIVMGVQTRRAGGSATLLVGAVIMFVAAGAGASSLWLSNVGELVLAVAITTAGLRYVAASDDSGLWTE